MLSAPMYHEGSRQLQDRFETRRLADRLVEVVVHDAFTDADRAFIESRPLFFLATADAEGRPDCSYKGGPSRLRPGGGSADAGVSQLRRQRHVQEPGQRDRQSARRAAVRRFRESQAPARERSRLGAGERSAARRVRRRPAHRARAASRRSFPTARATSTRCRWSRSHPTRRARATRPRCPSGRRARSSAKCLPPSDPASSA